MRSSRIRGSLTAVVVLIAFLAQGTWTLAGTTGTLTGTLANAQTGAPLSGVKVSVTSPSTTSSSTTDATGHFTFLALPPDTYLVSAAQSGYEPVSISGVTVLADQTRQLPLTMTPSLRVIARVTSRAATDLVKPGTTADVYSINATMQDKVSAMGGGGNINSAWSAIATVPGVFVQPGQNGYIGAGATFSIRGGDYDQVGFEIDGVPVNRAFDNYPSGPASSLGQQELQVYTGAAPASAEAQGLSGFINQVIRTGTYPAFGQATASVGGAAFYHKIAAEAGGATPTRNFSYYVGLGGYNQDFRFYDNFNGASLASMWGPAISVCDPSYTIQVAPSCFTNGQYNGNTAMDPLGFGDGKHGSFLLGPNLSSLGGIQDSASNVQDRDSIVNFHFAFPHKNGTKDDLQLLGVITALQNGFSTSTNDLGGAALLGGPLAPTVGLPTWFDGIEYHGPSGVPLPANYQALTAPYYFPSSPTNRPLGAPLPANLRDTSWNDQAISKLQYTHQMGDNAFLRVYGYMYYSDWILAGGPCGYMSFNYFFCPNAPDYELSSHTRGASAQFVDQITPQHLVTLQGSYTTATTIRNNNTEMYDTSTSSRRYLAVLVDSTAPTNGLCYTSAGVATTCYAVAPYQAAFATKQQALAGTIPAATGTCGGGPCEWFVVNPGPYATYNHVAPQFSSFSLTDQWRPTNKLSVDAGIRYDRYSYVGENTNTGPARTLFYNAFNLDTCLDANNNLYDKIVKLHLATPSAPCPAGFTAANFTNPSGQTTQSFPVWQPRLGVTYTLNPTSVVRASYGRFTQAPNSAFELYDTLQPNAPYYLYNVFGFQKFGFTSPAHNIPAASSNNFDLSLEHQFPNQWSTKLTPFYRRTQNQIQQFYLNQATSFVSGLPVGAQTSQGVEFELDKGNFAQDGVAGRMTFTYTNAYIQYQRLATGATIIDPLNQGIQLYNSYTSFCASNPADKRCGTPSNGAAAAACYTTAGAADPACAAGDVANPYWNAPVQGLLDPTGKYYPYSIFPAAIGTAVGGFGDSIGAPYIGTLVLQYKKGRWAITPALQFFAGQRYGAPLTTLGIDPAACTGVLASGSTSGDPRYPYGAAGGSPFDANTCGVLSANGGQTGIPNPYTKAFDGIGAFSAPTQLQLHLQASYDMSPKVSLVATVANVINTCFGGTKVPWSVSHGCSYTVTAFGTGGDGFAGDVGNLYNPGAVIQPYVNTPYVPVFTQVPPSIFVDLRFKL